jgi:hypothetical protein
MESYISTQLKEWKWSNGEKPERTPRHKTLKIQNNENNDNNDNNESFTEARVVNQCLYSGDEMLGLREALDHGQQQLMNEFQRQPNKREDTYNRMAEREMVGQRGMNPFFSGIGNSNNATSYIEDLMIQDNYLKPMSTSLEKEF